MNIDEFIDSFAYPTRAERVNVALISLLFDLNNKVGNLLPAEAIVSYNASSEPTEVSVEKTKKVSKKKVSK